MMFTHFFKIYETCGRRMMSLRRKFLTINTPNPHNKQISKQERIMRSQHGRSMVEMLGVLAIVGVLSVGGIAGYSKAMMKYKLNKQAQQLNQLCTAMTRYKNEWKFNEFTYLKDYYIKLGEIPKEMIKDNSKEYIYDVFDNQIYLRNNGAPTFNGTILRISLLGNKDFSVCQNIIQTAKEHSANIANFGVYYLATDATSENHGLFFRGDNYVNSKNKMLRNITLDDIKEQCQICEDTTKNKQCSFIFFWEIDT